jgi:hypothetical protein
VRAVPRLCEYYPGTCLTTEEKTRKNISQGKKNPSQGKKNLTIQEVIGSKLELATIVDANNKTPFFCTVLHLPVGAS